MSTVPGPASPPRAYSHLTPRLQSGPRSGGNSPSGARSGRAGACGTRPFSSSQRAERAGPARRTFAASPEMTMITSCNCLYSLRDNNERPVVDARSAL
jgi:hypothetical protein